MKVPIYSEGGKLLAVRNLELGTLEIVRRGILSVIRLHDDGTYQTEDTPN